MDNIQGLHSERGNSATTTFAPIETELVPLRSSQMQSESASKPNDIDQRTGHILSAAQATTPSTEDVTPQPEHEIQVSKVRGVTVIVTLAGMSFLNTMGSGILIAALPRIGRDVNLPSALLLWPAAVFALSAGCLLLIFGAAADAIGAKLVWIVGSYLFAVFTIALGFAKTGLQVIIFRTLLGIAIAMCLPTAVSLITNTFPKGPWRNVAFAMNGMGQPLGYALGLVLGGIFTDTIGWRWA